MVKCSECGFLALRNLDTRQLDEADKTFRDYGNTTTIEHWQEGPIDTSKYPATRHDYRPVCLARKADFYDLLEKRRKDSPGKTMSQGLVKDEIQSKRCCDKFTKWDQGFNPKEHREMIERKSLIKWRILEVAIIGLFTLGAAFMGAYIQRSAQPPRIEVQAPIVNINPVIQMPAFQPTPSIPSTEVSPPK